MVLGESVVHVVANGRRFPACLGIVALALAGGAAPGFADDAVAVSPTDPLAAAVPLLQRSCLDCHAGDTAEGEVDLTALRDPAAVRGTPRLVERVEEMVSSGQMPPPEADQPTAEERRKLGDRLRAFLAAEARLRAGDPGRVVLRRLNNAEYAHTIRDLTGVASLDPVREFPADAGAGDGATDDVVGWRSPLAGAVRVEGHVQSAQPVCGNGVAWDL